MNNPLGLNTSSTAINTLRYCLGGKKSQEENIKKGILVITSSYLSPLDNKQDFMSSNEPRSLNYER